MIIDDIKEYWVWCLRDDAEKFVISRETISDEDYAKHWGKFLVFGDAQYLADTAYKVNCYIDEGLIDSAKYNRSPASALGKRDCVMCVYSDDRDAGEVWKLLAEIGITKRIWKYDSQTIKDWSPGGKFERLVG